MPHTSVFLHRGELTCGRQISEPVMAVLTLPVFKEEQSRALLAQEQFHSAR
jgi:hypothetical protein